MSHEIYHRLEMQTRDNMARKVTIKKAKLLFIHNKKEGKTVRETISVTVLTLQSVYLRSISACLLKPRGAEH